MKTVLIISILVLCFTCWLGDSGAPPSPIGMTIKDVSESSYGSIHEDASFGDFTFDDSARSSPFITKIEDNSQGHQAEFPMGLR
jgi:hypothetical protein